MPGPTPAGRDFDSRAAALLAAQAALEKQAADILVMDVRALSAVTEFFVVCTAASTPQLRALTDHIEAALAGRGWPVWHTEGVAAPGPGAPPNEPRWILLDCGDIVVHLLDPRARAFYRLEHLWGDAPRVPVDAEARSSPA